MNLCRDPPSDILRFLAAIVAAVERNMDGTSGALYSIFLNAFVAHFKQCNADSVVVDRDMWVAALSHGVDTLFKYTPARRGDRTLMDALIPFRDALVAGNSLSIAAEAAVAGAESTRNMSAKLGRAVYVGGQQEWVGSIPDPGAWGLSKFLFGMAAAQ